MSGQIVIDCQTISKVVNIERAKAYLNRCRSNNPNNFLIESIDYLRKYCKKAGVTLADVGTSDDEIASWLKADWTKEAIRCLNNCRSETIKEFLDREIYYIIMYCLRTGSSLADIGTSQAELEMICNRITEGRI